MWKTIIKGIKDFGKDLFTPQLFILKITYFLLLAAVVLIWPQLSIHQNALGLTGYQTGLFGAAVSSFSIISPLISGAIGDKIGNYKILMSVTTITAGGCALLFAWVPSAMVDATTSNSSTSEISITSNISSDPARRSQVVDPDKLVTTFWWYMAVRVSYSILQGTGYTLFEGAVMANMQKSDINFGYQRVWGTVAVIISPYLGGILVDITGGFSMLFYVAAILQVLTGLFMLGVNIDFKVPASSLSKNIFVYFFKPEGLLLFGAMLATGMFIGHIETFMYRFLFEELGGTSTLSGLTVTVAAPFELVLMLLTPYFVKRVGHAPIIMVGILSYSVRFIGYSFLVDPWWALAIEIFDSVATGMLFPAAIMYCTVLFPMEAIASFRGMFGAIYFGIGKLLGTIIGTEIRELLGSRPTFRIWSAIALACTAIYCVAYFLLKKQRSAKLSIKTFKTYGGAAEKGEKASGIDNPAWVGSD